jgi:hypothetical protein
MFSCVQENSKKKLHASKKKIHKKKNLPPPIFPLLNFVGVVDCWEEFVAKSTLAAP